MGAEDHWRRGTLGDLARVRSGYAFKSSEWRQFGVPVVKIGNVKAGCLEMDGCSCVEPSTAEASGFVLRRGDILIGLTGYVGDTAIVRNEGPLVLNQRVGKAFPLPDADPLFIYFTMSSPSFRAAVEAASHGSAQANVSPFAIEGIPVLIPPTSEQRTIANILGALDNKIELSRRTAMTLESIAKAMFKSWLVDFDPACIKARGLAPSGMDAATARLFPNEFEPSELGDIPKGWNLLPLDEIAEFKNGLPMQRFRPSEGEPRLPTVKIAQLRTGEPDSGEWARADIDPAFVVQDGDVIFSWSGSLTVAVWCGGRAALNQHLFRVTSGAFPKWFYLQWLLVHLPEFQRIAGDKATTMGHIQRHHLSSAMCVVPPEELTTALSSLFMPILDSIISLNLQIRSLKKTRDALLPRLLSGEIDVSDAERFAGAAL